MLGYLIKRFLLIFPTLLGILAINFFIIQLAPGGPVEQVLSRMKGQESDMQTRLGGGGGDTSQQQDLGSQAAYQGAQGVDPKFIAQLEQQFGFDQPAYKRFLKMVSEYLIFDFGTSYFKAASVWSLIKDRLPVSISLGMWTTLLIYLISIPLGIQKAVRHGTFFDAWTSFLVIIGYAVPGFLFALILMILFSGGHYFQWFPLRGLTSENWSTLSWWGKICDYIWHITLPVIAMVVSGFAKLTLLTKNSFLEEINKQYVMTARAKGASEHQVLYGHVFRNAALVILAGFPATFIRIFFTSSLLIEVLFSLDGLGLLGFEAAMSRDYPVMFATLYIYTLIGLVLYIITDILYMLVDPRIDLSKR